MFGRAFRFAIPVISTGAIIATNSNGLILNETSSNRRNFYEDESDVVNIPGTVTAAPASEIQALGTNRIIDGISVRSTSTTEHLFKSVREFTEYCGYSVQQWLNSSYTKYNATEKAVTDTVSGLHNKSEDLLPNSLYIVIAFLAGTIAGRPRGIMARVTFPTVFGLGAFKYFLPHTFDNSIQFLWQVEQNKMPVLAKQQEATYNSAVELVHSIEETTENSKKSIEERANSLRKSIADITGLNIDEEVSKK